MWVIKVLTAVLLLGGTMGACVAETQTKGHATTVACRMPLKAAVSEKELCDLFQSRLAVGFPATRFERASDSATADITLALTTAHDRGLTGQILVRGQPDGPMLGTVIADRALGQQRIGLFLDQLIGQMPQQPKKM